MENKTRELGLTSEQLNARKYTVGGSDVPTILGFSSYSTPFELLWEKVFGKEQTANLYTIYGDWAEDMIQKNELIYVIKDSFLNCDIDGARVNIDGLIGDGIDVPIGYDELSLEQAHQLIKQGAILSECKSSNCIDINDKKFQDKLNNYWIPQVQYCMGNLGIKKARISVYLRDKEDERKWMAGSGQKAKEIFNGFPIEQKEQWYDWLYENIEYKSENLVNVDVDFDPVYYAKIKTKVNQFMMFLRKANEQEWLMEEEEFQRNFTWLLPEKQKEIYTFVPAMPNTTNFMVNEYPKIEEELGRIADLEKELKARKKELTDIVNENLKDVDNSVIGPNFKIFNYSTSRTSLDTQRIKDAGIYDQYTVTTTTIKKGIEWRND